MRGRKAFLRELVDGGLVRADLEEIRIRPHLVQRSAQKHFVRRDAGEVERARRQQEHTVRCAGKVILAVAAILEKRDDNLPRLTEVEHRVAQLLNLGPERRLE